ncbi:acetyl esterase [Cupriavidus gilardii J11]|uniref:Acetyl esterase n=1 Tax=Cupriavidus gilardii J11 TaxID=936133 RepID=A0A562BTM4_9BURK|nr:alpha/beta hydrolase [Cupriavidus gilardii]TWG88130.1 acetyl esterase [Cupriavidus gilardii J11]
MAIDPDLLAYYRDLAARYAGLPVPSDAVGRRERFSEIAALSREQDPAELEISPLTLALEGRTLHARMFRPVGVERPRALVYFHGGGWVVGSHDTHHGVAAQLARDSGLAVISVDYRLAPEHPYPAPCDDAHDAVRWVAVQREALGLSLEALVVAGDSAGAHLAAQAATQANGTSPGLVAAQLLIYPAILPALASESYRAFAEGPGLTRDEMTWYWTQFIGADAVARGATVDDPRINLLRSDPSAVPPTSVVLVAAHDVLRDDGLAYADHLVRWGAAVVTIEASGMTHGFARLQPHAPRAREWMRRATAALVELIEDSAATAM